MTTKDGKSYKSYKSYKKELLKDPEVKKEYDALQKSYDIAKMIYSIRTEANLTQEQLAKQIGTKQANISRAEKGSSNITISTLAKITEAVGYELLITVKPIAKKPTRARPASRKSAMPAPTSGRIRNKKVSKPSDKKSAQG
jgi:transcriptional regulator with XRE-family HTH domain